MLWKLNFTPQSLSRVAELPWMARVLTAKPAAPTGKKSSVQAAKLQAEAVKPQAPAAKVGGHKVVITVQK